MRPIAPLLLVTAVLLAAPAAAQTPDQTTEAETPVPTIVKIHADWCGKCASIEPAWERVEEELGDDVRVVVFDVTDQETTRAAASRAEELGFETFFAANKARTGLVAVFPPGETEEPSKILVAEKKFDPYRDAVVAVTPGE